MKKCRWIVMLTLVLALSVVAPALAKQGDKTLDASIDLATAPVSGFDSTLGFTVGFGYELEQELQLRGDISYYSYDQDFFGDSLTYTRVPVAASVRKYFPLNPQKNVNLFVQGGLELSFDEAETSVNLGFPFGTVKASGSEVNLGLVGGGGVEFALSREFGLGGIAKYHVISNDYLTLGLYGAYHF
ncbi:MAG TPA: outer membrane beta-barrel protein [Geobacterales bacterium]|nr:outer membrane beta-barrel protein [Geobacterales bacterium]